MEERIFGLDVVRATAVTLVVVHHGFDILAFPFPQLPDGVDIFFVLSGFLIGQILIRMTITAYGLSLRNIKVFLLRRWLRTLPAMWFALVINFGITFLLSYRDMPARIVARKVLLEDCIWEYVFFLQNLTDNLRSSFFPESWSLSVEEWFYLVLPVLLFLLQNAKLNRRIVLLLAIFLMIATPSIVRFYLSDIHSHRTWMLTRMIVVMRLDSIGFGVFLAYVASFRTDDLEKMAEIAIFIDYRPCFILHYILDCLQRRALHWVHHANKHALLSPEQRLRNARLAWYDNMRYETRISQKRSDFYQ